MEDKAVRIALGLVSLGFLIYFLFFYNKWKLKTTSPINI